MKQVVVTIHGTGRAPHDFWVPQLAAITSHLGWEPPHRPVWWGDLIDVGKCLLAVRRRLDARLCAARSLHLGRWHIPLVKPCAALRAFFDWGHRFLNGCAGVATYFIPLRNQEPIRHRLRRVLDDLTRAGHEIILISESLGCLIAFDVLRADAHHYRIGAWFTLGSPLRILVHTGQRSADLGAINPQTVRQWRNLYTPRDPVGGPVGKVFRDYPVHDHEIAGPPGRIESHDYWNNPLVPKFIADALRKS